MKHTSPASQRGISFIGLLFLGVVLAFVAIVGAKVVPTASEYMSIVKAAKKAAGDGDTVPAVRASSTARPRWTTSRPSRARTWTSPR
jgi:hypothetical protein